MSGIFDEKSMVYALERNLPGGEKVSAGIYACAYESQVNRIFSGGVLVDNTLVPSEDGGVMGVRKSKYSTYDIYLGISSQHLVIAECEGYKHLYEYDVDLDPNVVAVTEVHDTISLEEIGNCYPLEEIRNCEIKKGWMGSVKCNITMKNGDYFKLMFPKRGGLGGGMPHHAQYREEIIACMRAHSV